LAPRISQPATQNYVSILSDSKLRSIPMQSATLITFTIIPYN